MTEQLHQTGKSRSSSVDSNSVEGTETDAPIRQLIAQWREQARPHLNASGDESEWAAARMTCADELEPLVAAAEARASQAERERDEQARMLAESRGTLTTEIERLMDEKEALHERVADEYNQACEEMKRAEAAEARADLLQQEIDALKRS